MCVVRSFQNQELSLNLASREGQIFAVAEVSCGLHSAVRRPQSADHWSVKLDTTAIRATTCMVQRVRGWTAGRCMQQLHCSIVSITIRLQTQSIDVI